MVSNDARQAPDLPYSFGPLIGRSVEVAEILALLSRARLFTLTGPGGSGKTRLAAQVAAEGCDAFPDGVRWVDLAAVSNPELVSHAVAVRCGLKVLIGLATLDALVAAFRPRRLLLVLDNCEHLLAGCAPMVETLLSTCPELTILATSREALALPGEVIWFVAPLRVPEPDAEITVENLLTYEAIALFVARASDAVPKFRVTTANAPSVVQICRLVAGLPLALELAAARLRLLSPAELATRLDDGLRILTYGSRTAPPRQQTLRATLDWSYRLLTDAERAVFGRLAVFPASFSLESVERVCIGPETTEEDVFSVLSRLVEQSLVSVDDQQEETRFRLLEPIRQYARERLVETGELALAESQLREWCVDLSERAVTELSGPEQGRWLDRLETEQDSLHAAIAWSLDHDDPESAGRIAAGVWQFWLLRGHQQVGHLWLERIVATLREPFPLQAHLLWIAGILARPDAELAQRRFEESLAIWRSLGDQGGIARVLGSQGFMAQVQGEHTRAVAYLEKCLPLVRASADTPTYARVLSGLALSLLEIGDQEGATTHCLEAVAICRKGRDIHGTAAAMANLGLIAYARGDERRAADMWNESLAMRRRIGDRGGEAHVLTLLGSLAVSQGDYARAVTLYLDALAARVRMRDDDGIPPILEGLAAICAAQNDPVMAIELAGHASVLRETTGVPSTLREQATHDRTVAKLRARVDPETFARGWEAGRAFSLQDARERAARLQGASFGLIVDAPARSPVIPSTASVPALTRRETDVLRLLTFGLTYAQIAETLVISPRTVDAHVRAIYAKLEVRSRNAATRVALQERLV